jgi:S-adenosylmethionine/arginine decarboxylase-like enzyme
MTSYVYEPVSFNDTECAGKHVWMEGYPTRNTNADAMQLILQDAVTQADATIIQSMSPIIYTDEERAHQNNIIVCAVLSESHIVIQKTYDDKILADIYTCSATDPAAALPFIKKQFGIVDGFEGYALRGVLDSNQSKIENERLRIQEQKHQHQESARQYLVDLKNAHHLKSSDLKKISEIFTSVAHKNGCQVDQEHTHFKPFGGEYGLSGIMNLKTAQGQYGGFLTIHTWPETGTATLDCYFNGHSLPSRTLLSQFMHDFDTQTGNIHQINRNVNTVSVPNSIPALLLV